MTIPSISNNSFVASKQKMSMPNRTISMKQEMQPPQDEYTPTMPMVYDEIQQQKSSGGFLGKALAWTVGIGGAIFGAMQLKNIKEGKKVIEALEKEVNECKKEIVSLTEKNKKAEEIAGEPTNIFTIAKWRTKRIISALKGETEGTKKESLLDKIKNKFKRTKAAEPPKNEPPKNEPPAGNDEI